MNKTPNVTWIAAALVERGMRQVSMNPPVSEIADVVDANQMEVIVSYTDGTTRPYHRHEPLPILTPADAR